MPHKLVQKIEMARPHKLSFDKALPLWPDAYDLSSLMLVIYLAFSVKTFQDLEMLDKV